MFFGVLLAIFSIVRMVVFIPVGWWADARPFREVLSITAFVGFVGCLIYGAAGAMGSKYYLILGRALTGFGASNTTLSRTYISQCVHADDFSAEIGKQMVFNLLGVMLGPAIIGIVRDVEFDLGWFHFNEQTAPGYIMALLQLGMLASFLTIFNEPPVRKMSTIRKEGIDDEGAGGWEGIKRCLGSGGGWFMLLTTFCVNFQVGWSKAGWSEAATKRVYRLPAMSEANR
jgi:MFS family permease